MAAGAQKREWRVALSDFPPWRQSGKMVTANLGMHELHHTRDFTKAA